LKSDRLLKIAFAVVNLGLNSERLYLPFIGRNLAAAYLPFVVPLVIVTIPAITRFAHGRIILSVIIAIAAGILVFFPYIFLKYYVSKKAARLNWDFNAIDSPERLQKKFYVWHFYSGMLALISCAAIFYWSIVFDVFPKEFLLFGCLLFFLAASHLYIVNRAQSQSSPIKASED
jgi:hypothetical protein